MIVPPFDQNIAALIFDCDGTLVDTAPLHYRAWSTALTEQGVEMPRDWYFDRLGLSGDALLDALAREFGAVVDRGSLAVRRHRTFEAGLQTLAPIPEVASVVHEHRGLLPMAVASGGDRALVLATLDAAGLSETFDVVVTVSEVGEGKPSPALFEAAARRLDAPAAHCLVFEDTDEGVEAARRAGMRWIDVREHAAIYRSRRRSS